MGEIWLHEAVFRQRPELCVTVGYMKLFIERETQTVGDSWLHEALCRQ